jgi:peptidoglycan/LPS O-acetylase OafA/YrhL
MRKRRLWLMALWFLSPFVFASLNFFHRETALEQSVQIIASPVNIDFAAGVFLGVVWHKWTKTFTFEMGVSPVVVFVVAMVLLMAVGFALNPSFDSIWITSLSALTCGAIVFAGIHVRCPEAPLDRTAKLLGDASYSVYLFHPHAISAILGVWSEFAHGTPIIVVLIDTVMLATGFGVMIHLFVEQPLIRLARRAVGLSGSSFAWGHVRSPESGH